MLMAIGGAVTESGRRAQSKPSTACTAPTKELERGGAIAVLVKTGLSDAVQTAYGALL